MAGMFYSLKEAAVKLNMAEEQLKELVRQGRLREFRDGSNVLFKVDEVEGLMSDTSIPAAQEAPAAPQQVPDEDEITLAAETTGGSTTGSDLTDADTVIAEQASSVLGETGSGYQTTDDTMAETTGTTEGASLEEIEEDVNLDTFGSGSGLLDLSLQADDTSLGGILDEIYTPEGGEGQEAAKSGSASAIEMAAEAEQMLPEEEELAVPEPTPEVPVMAQTYVEAAPDRSSDIFGIMLFLPLLALVYMAIVTVAGQVGVMPAILGKVQGVILPVLGGLAVVALILTAAGFMPSGGGKKKAAGKVKKAKKAKKEKKPKKKKEKKAKGK